MRVRVGCQFDYEAEVPTHAVVQVEPRLDAGGGTVTDRWETTPALATSRYVDGFGNLCRRTTLPAGPSTLRYDAEMEVSPEPDPEGLAAVEHAPADLPDEALVYTLPSRFCPSWELADDAWTLFGVTPRGWSRVQAICDWVHESITFDYQQTSPTATAADVYRTRHGVCRDFAHLGVTFCRALNIPARYAFGYLPSIGRVPTPPMDFAAWMEVYLGGRWWTFDPRNNERRIGRVLIGRGRDALDVAMVSTFGGPELRAMVVWADEIP